MSSHSVLGLTDSPHTDYRINRLCRESSIELRDGFSDAHSGERFPLSFHTLRLTHPSPPPRFRPLDSGHTEQPTYSCPFAAPAFSLTFIRAHAIIRPSPAPPSSNKGVCHAKLGETRLRPPSPRYYVAAPAAPRLRRFDKLVPVSANFESRNSFSTLQTKKILYHPPDRRCPLRSSATVFHPSSKSHGSSLPS